MKRRSVLFALFAFALNASTVLAISLEFTPVSQTVTVGTQATVEVRVGGLGTNSPPDPIVAAYDFNVLFDPSILSFAGISFGTALGGSGDSIQSSVSGSGAVNAAELSLLSNVALANLQDSLPELVLFSLNFNTIGVGTSALAFFGNIAPSGDFLGDEGGNVIPLAPADVGTGAITVNPRAIPEPATLGLMATAACAMVWQRRSRNRYLRSH